MAASPEEILSSQECVTRRTKELENTPHKDHRYCGGDYSTFEEVINPIESGAFQLENPDYENLDSDAAPACHRKSDSSGSLSLKNVLDKPFDEGLDENTDDGDEPSYAVIPQSPEHNKGNLPYPLSSSKNTCTQQSQEDEHLEAVTPVLDPRDDEPIYEDPENLDENARYYFSENSEILQTGENRMPKTWDDYVLKGHGQRAYRKGVNCFQVEIRKQVSRGLKPVNKDKMIHLCRYLAISSFHLESNGHETMEGIKYLEYYKKLLKEQVEHYRLKTEFED